MADPSAQDILLEIMQRELKDPQLSLAQALEMPFAKVLLERLTKAAQRTQLGSGPEDGTPDRARISNFPASPAFLRASIEDTFDMADLTLSDIERDALLAASDVVMTATRRRLRLRDASRAEILDAAIGTDTYENLLRNAVEADKYQHEEIGHDPIRLPSAWLRCFLSEDFADLGTAPPRELKAALAARERLRLVTRLGKKIPSLDELRRRVGFAELLEPLRLLTGEQGGWDGTPRIDRFVGRDDELAELRAFVDEQRSQGVLEAVSRTFTRVTRAARGGKSPTLIIVEAQGGLGKSTLLAKFVLDHTFDQYRRFPFAYLDFDRAGIDPARPQQLLIEIARQVGLQFPGAQPKLEALRASVRAELVRPITDSSVTATSEIRDPFAQFAEILREHATFGTRAFLLVLDTLEVVQWDSSAMAQLAGLIDEFRDKGLDELRVVASGRADIPELKRGKEEKDRLPALHISLKPLLIKEARQMADMLGKAAIGSHWRPAWSSALAGASIDAAARREPLAVRVAVDLVAYAEPLERQGIVDDITRSGPDTKQDFIARLYEKRIVNHVRDRNARKLAWPGLVVRRITAEIARELLAGFCDIAPEDAEKAFKALGQEIWMVTSEGDALRHRPDLRARTLPLMRSKDGEKFDAIAHAAADYFKRNRARSPENYVEWIYHRLLIGERPEDVERDTTAEVMSRLTTAEADFPPSSPVASYLAARTARTRLPPRRLRALRPPDALHHLRVTSANAFALDDISLDRIVLEVSGGLKENKELRTELEPWARAIWIKTGAWRRLSNTPRSYDQLSGEVLRSHMFWSARLCATLDLKGRKAFAADYLRALTSSTLELERAGFRTTVHAMALARIAGLDEFARLDAQVTQMLSQMKTNPLPSTQAALRTAIVLGESCRVPAANLWLDGRRRGSSDRVRNPTVASAELLGLVKIYPQAGEPLSQAISYGADAPLRFADNTTVAEWGRVMEEIVADSGERNELLPALSRVFATRDEDWVIPLAYAAAAAHPAPLSGALSKRLAGYQGPHSSSATSNEMVGVMRQADEAGDLMGFARLVLERTNADVPAAADLRFLLDCCAAWHRVIDDIIGTRDPSPPEAPPAMSNEPPAPGDIVHRSDPQKDRWGGLESRGGRTARAVLESVERDVFYFSVIVESTDGSPLEAPVVFHLHDSYPRSVVKIRRIVDGKIARLSEWSATGIFAIGIQVKDAVGDWIPLELDLARLSSLPKRFLEH